MQRFVRSVMTNSGCWAGGGNAPPRQSIVGLTDQTFTCAARAHVAAAARRTACTHVSRAMQAARRRSAFDFTSRLGRRTEAGPRQVLRRVRPLEATLSFA